jgi:hypothetical protein
VLHQPEEIISIGDKVCRLGFKFDWTFEWEGKHFKCNPPTTGCVDKQGLATVSPGS